MKSAGVLLLVGLLTLWMELPAATWRKGVRAGTCPVDNSKCYGEVTGDCAVDSDCKEQKKCCSCRCKLRCMEPAEETPGTCPAISVFCPRGRSRNSCVKDSKCPENQKCCNTSCGKNCVWPKHA